MNPAGGAQGPAQAHPVFYGLNKNNNKKKVRFSFFFTKCFFFVENAQSHIHRGCIYIKVPLRGKDGRSAPILITEIQVILSEPKTGLTPPCVNTGTLGMAQADQVSWSSLLHPLPLKAPVAWRRILGPDGVCGSCP